MSEQDATLTPAAEPELILEEDALPETDDGLEELEIGPEKYKVPKAIKEGWSGLQKSVQTDKEALKAEKAAVERERASMAEAQRTFGVVAKDYAALENVNTQLEPYKDYIDHPEKWAQLRQQDQGAYDDHKAFFDGLITKRQTLYTGLQGKMAAAQEADRKSQAERVAQAEKELPAKIKDWSPAKKEAVMKAGVELGFSNEELGPLMYDPRIIGALDEIAQFRAAKARAAAAKEAARKAAAEGQPEPEPSTRVKSSTATTTTVPRDNDDDATWLKKRQQQLQKAGKRW